MTWTAISAGPSEAAGAAGADQRREKLPQGPARVKSHIAHLAQQGSFAARDLPVGVRLNDVAASAPSHTQPASPVLPDGVQQQQQQQYLAVQQGGRSRAAPGGVGETIRELLQANNIFLREYTAGQHRATCPKCSGGSTFEKSLSVLINENGQHASCKCHRARCGWMWGSTLGETKNTQLKAGKGSLLSTSFVLRKELVCHQARSHFYTQKDDRLCVAERPSRASFVFVVLGQQGQRAVRRAASRKRRPQSPGPSWSPSRPT